MQTIHYLVWLTAFGFAQAACSDSVLIAATPQGGDDSSTGSSDATSDTGSGDGRIGSCLSTADCPAHQLCGFLESLGCAAQGQCFVSPAAVCLAYSAGCACDGTEISVACTGLPAGYASQPLAHVGPCSDADTASDAGVACAAKQGDHCGGNTRGACTCMSGLVCTPGDSGLPFGDVGGTCEPSDGG